MMKKALIFTLKYQFFKYLALFVNAPDLYNLVGNVSHRRNIIQWNFQIKILHISRYQATDVMIHSGT